MNPPGSFIAALQAVVARYPSSPALLDRGVASSYQELWDEALRTGAFLRSKGIGAEDLVGLNIAKSKDYIVALLGAWMAGAAFLPLDPSLPKERLDFILAEARPRHVLAGLPVQEQPPLPAPHEAAPGDLAYVIYTSGSSGTPKGVMVCHRGLVPMLKDQVAAFGLGPGKNALFYLSISFDASLSDIGTSLLSGACLVIEDDAKLRDGAALLDILESRHITHFDCPPSLLRALPPEAAPACLETVIIGGEPCPPETVRDWAKHRRVVNVYGPTEATICSSLCLCGAETWRQPLLGRPVPGTLYHVIDDELHIEGDGLARGYLERPALTAEKFVTVGGKRLYRTGDRVRALPDGDFLFLGRLDRQFKLRGQLVEPGEIEARLLQQSVLVKAAVLKRPLAADMPNEALVAFVSPPGVSPGVLRNALQKTLPAWMIPDHIESLASLPETASGKPDYTALNTLPLRLRRRPAAGDELRPVETSLLQAWRRVLGHDRFGLDDNFLDVGGDSLNVIQLTLEAERLGLRLTPALLVLNPTIRQLAQVLEAGARPAGAAPDSLAAAELRRRAAPDAALERLLKEAAARPPQKAEDINTLFLTGVTGSLGSRLLPELLARTTAKIYCLVRAADETEAEARLAKLGFRSGRVTALAGDVARDRFGLSPQRWQALADDLDAIYHCAAEVNMTKPFDALAPANLGGVREVLRLALTGKRKQLHCASTLSVFVATDRNTGTALETDALENTARVYGGYAQTKWAADWLLHQVPREAAHVAQYRFGLVTGDSQSGLAAGTDFLSLFIKGLSSLGYTPPRADMSALAVDITPVDHAARAMAEISLKPGNGGVYHIANRESLPLTGLLAALERCGTGLRECSAEDWKNLPAGRPLTAAEASAWLSLCRVLPEPDFERLRVLDLFQATRMTFDMSRSGFTCPEPGEVIDRYLRHILAQERDILRVCLVGPESTGKSTLAERLARHFGAAHAAEFAKAHIEARGGNLGPEDIPAIAAGQLAAEDGAALAAKNLLICDTDLRTTKLWSEWLFGDCPAWIRAEAGRRAYDLYLLTDLDVPFVKDLHRLGTDRRQEFMALCEKELAGVTARQARISGDWDNRFNRAVAEIDRLLRETSSARSDAA